MKKQILILGLLAISIKGMSQQKVEEFSLNIEDINWRTTKIIEGVEVRKASANLFDSPQEISIVDIDTTLAKVKYDVGMAKVMERTSVQAKAKNAIAAINGSFFRNHSEPLGESMHFIMIDGEVKAHTVKTEYLTRATGVITVKENYIDISNWNSDKELGYNDKADDVLVSGPLLMDDGRLLHLSYASFNTKRHPRSFMAFANNHLLMVVVDGRSETAAGMTLNEVLMFGKFIGCTDIINLDGGGSSTLFVKGYDDDEIVNTPSDGKERSVKGIFYVTIR
ncbi:phosphodiester glycosidase family protein [Aestuariibaculum sediminum]|uniref:Phosphodiester glycosidase family protein n=1 Tax=Aestuariibaculum sediminum TaxID=2770637 RepID=A0A8J6QCP2_9FLAO|nr:phosphodiester glycosidase family protein [Aestuariibaculum sediminum]MBD0833661.1 phosphodiester glycosidase family protein [Aestuariibaculum sediminum]